MRVGSGAVFYLFLLLAVLAVCGCNKNENASAGSDQASVRPAEGGPEAGAAVSGGTCEGSLVYATEDRFACKVDGDCINTCRYGAVNRAWAAEVDGICPEGCDGIPLDQPQCVEGMCVAFSFQGASVPECTRKAAPPVICVGDGE